MGLSQFNNMLPAGNSVTGKSIKTSAQAFIGACITLAVGLWMAIETVPGCPEAIIQFIQSNFIQIAAAIGVSSGVATVVWYKGIDLVKKLFS